MRRMLLTGAMALMTVVAGCGGGGGHAPAVTPTPTPTPTPPPMPTPTPTPTPTARINRDIKVVYLGGAVTAGLVATNNRGYATLITEYLTAQFRSVQARNLGLGRTDSLFGAHRIDQDLSGFAADYAFISYTNNDDRLVATNTYTDAMIYKLRRLNPNVVIAIVAITNAGDEANRRAGIEPTRIANLRTLAAAENVEFIDAGAALWRKVISENRAITDFLPDGGNPNDAGHAVYADAIKANLDPRLDTLTGLGRVESRYIAQTNLQDARIVTTSAVTANTCPIRDLGSAFINSALDCAAGQGFTFGFTGTSFGFIRGLVTDGGRLECTVDGTLPMNEVFYEAGSNQVAIRSRLFYTGLPNASHSATCRVSATVPPGSTGTRVVVGGFLVNSGQPIANP